VKKKLKKKEDFQFYVRSNATYVYYMSVLIGYHLTWELFFHA
jgi:hypothetical protein